MSVIESSIHSFSTDKPTLSERIFLHPNQYLRRMLTTSLTEFQIPILDRFLKKLFSKLSPRSLILH